MKRHSEKGIALLGTVLVLALVLGLAAWGVINMTGDAQQSVYNEATANQARTAALVGIQAATAYVQSVYVGSNPPSSASLANLAVTSDLESGSGLINQSLSPINGANVQAMVTANTFSSTSSNLVSATGSTGSAATAASGYIRLLSTGRSGGAIQTAETYLTAQLNNLDKYNANLILGPNSTFNGNLNKGGIPVIVVASTASTAQSAGISLNGTNYTYLPISQFPIINATGFSQYATIQLGAGDDDISVPPSSASFYSNLYGANYLSTLDSDFTYASSTNTWTMNEPVPGFIYAGSTSGPSININIAFSGSAETTVVSTGTITVSGDVAMSPFAAMPPQVSYNNCGQSSSLPICIPGVTPAISYTNIQGLVLLSNGNIQYTNGSHGSSFAGDVATAGSLNLSGGGTYSFGGTIVAVNGVTSSKGNSSGNSTVNGAITLTSPVATANSATLGGYQLTPTSLRWLP